MGVSQVRDDWLLIFQQNVHVVLFCLNVRSIKYFCKNISGVGTELVQFISNHIRKSVCYLNAFIIKSINIDFQVSHEFVEAFMKE